MYRVALAAFTSLGLSVGSVLAADLPRKAPPPVQPVTYAPIWTGFYIGAHLGAGWGTTETSIPGEGPGDSDLPWSQRQSNGLLGGGQVGFNWQAGWAVFGVEGSFSWADINGKAPCGIGNFFTCRTETNWIATATGRIGGVVADRTLVYLKGGAAWKDTDYSSTGLEFVIFGDEVVVKTDKTRFGWLVGAGAEYAFLPNWTGFIEYNYMDFGNKTLRYSVFEEGEFDGTTDVRNKDVLHVIKAGVNYRFNWGWGR
jgi:outer membrane immunogenic protein